MILMDHRKQVAELLDLLSRTDGNLDQQDRLDLYVAEARIRDSLQEDPLGVNLKTAESATDMRTSVFLDQTRLKFHCGLVEIKIRDGFAASFCRFTRTNKCRNPHCSLKRYRCLN
jgi:hypothetical protein